MSLCVCCLQSDAAAAAEEAENNWSQLSGFRALLPNDDALFSSANANASHAKLTKKQKRLKREAARREARRRRTTDTPDVGVDGDHGRSFGGDAAAADTSSGFQLPPELSKSGKSRQALALGKKRQNTNDTSAQTSKALEKISAQARARISLTGRKPGANGLNLTPDIDLFETATRDFGAAEANTSGGSHRQKRGGATGQNSADTANPSSGSTAPRGPGASRGEVAKLKREVAQLTGALRCVAVPSCFAECCDGILQEGVQTYMGICVCVCFTQVDNGL